jgi:hypothetical protein
MLGKDLKTRHLATLSRCYKYRQHQRYGRGKPPQKKFFFGNAFLVFAMKAVLPVASASVHKTTQTPTQLSAVFNIFPCTVPPNRSPIPYSAAKRFSTGTAIKRTIGLRNYFHFHFTEWKS